MGETRGDVAAGESQNLCCRGGETMSGVNPGSAVLDVSKIRAEEGKGCPRCGGKVFMAEEINAKGRVSVAALAGVKQSK